MKTWRYHFIVPVRQQLNVDRPFPPIPQHNQPGGKEGIVANIPSGDSRPPVFIPWSNIRYVEEVK